MFQGILKNENGANPITYNIVETDGYTLRVAGEYDVSTKSQEWFDLRPMNQDPKICAGIISNIEDRLGLNIPKVECGQLTHWHNSGLVAAYGIFQFENSRFLVTDAYGGQTFHNFLNYLTPEERPTLGAKDVVAFLRGLSQTLLLWKKSHEYISNQTVLVSYNHDMLHTGLVCFPEKFPNDILSEFETVLRPTIYNRKLTNQKFVPDDPYALALITMQLLAWNVGITEPMLAMDMLEKFRTLIQDKNMARFYQSKLKPTIHQLFEGAITIERLEQICQDMEKDLDQAKRLAENVRRYASFSQESTPQLLRGSFYFSFHCTYCNTVFPGLNAEYSEPCPICHRKAELPLVLTNKICRWCKTEFPQEVSLCPNCQGKEKLSDEVKEDMVKAPPLTLGNIEGSEEMRLTILPLEEVELEKSSLPPSTAKIGTKPSGRSGKTPVLHAPESPSSLANLLTLNIESQYSDGDVTVLIKNADMGEWRFQITSDAEGEKTLEQVEYNHKIKGDLNQIISLDFEAIEDTKCVYLFTYLNMQLIDRKTIAIEA